MTDPTARPRAYSYLRFSSPEQMKGGSLERQKRLVREYVQKHGLELDTELTFHDLGKSAFRGQNLQVGKLGEFLEAVHTGLVQRGSYLLVESLDRISRDQIVEAQTAFLTIITYGIVLVTLGDGRTYSRESLNKNPADLLVSVALLMRSHDESAHKSMRHRDNWRRKREHADKRPLTKCCPSWLRLREDRSGFDVLEDRAKVVRRIYREALAGVTTYRIAHTLNLEGVPPFADPGKKRQPAVWHKSYVVKILQNPAVIGTYTPHLVKYKGTSRQNIPLDPIPGYYPPVVDEVDFHRVQSMKEGNSAPLRGRHAGKVVANIWASLARCPRCGAVMQLNSKSRTSPKYLVCGGARNGSGCTWTAVRYSRTEEAFLREARRLLSECPSEHEQARELEQRLTNIEADIQHYDDAIEAVLRHIQAGTSGETPDAVNRSLLDLESKRDALRQRESEIRAVLDSSFGVLLNKKLDDLHTALFSGDEIDRARVNALLRQLLSKVVMDWGSGHAMLYWKHGGVSMFLYEWPKEKKQKGQTA